MEKWTLVTYYKSLNRYCLFIGTEDGYKVAKIFSNKTFARVYAMIHDINFTEGAKRNV